MNASPKLCTVRVATDKLLVVSYEGNSRRVLLNTQTRRAMTFDDRLKVSGCIWKLQNIGLRPSDFTGLMTREVFDNRVAQMRNENGYATF